PIRTPIQKLRKSAGNPSGHGRDFRRVPTGFVALWLIAAKSICKPPVPRATIVPASRPWSKRLRETGAMSSAGSVTHWIRELKAGNHLAAQRLWEKYFQRLVALARTKLGNRPRRVADEEDVAVNAFDSFFRGAQMGRFPQLLDRDDLWQLLVMIT